MPPTLTARFAGLPRWAWVLILTSGLLIGVALRRRQAAAAAGETEDPNVTDPEVTGDPVSYGVEPAYPVVGGGGGLTPVESPTLPEGYADGFGKLVEGIVAISTTKSDNAAATTQTAIENPPPAAPVPAVTTGGGPPAMVPDRSVVKAPPKVERTRRKYRIERTRMRGGKKQFFWNGNWHSEEPPMEYFWNGNWHTAPPGK